MAAGTIGVAVDRDDTLAIDREHHRTVGRSLTGLADIRRFTLQIEVVATQIGIGRDIHLLTTLNGRIGIDQQTVDSRRRGKVLHLPGREIPLGGLTQRLGRNRATLHAGDIDRHGVLGERLQPLDRIGMGSLLLAREFEGLTCLNSRRDTYLIYSSRLGPTDRQLIGTLLEECNRLLIAGREARRTTYSRIAAEVYGVERAGRKTRQRIDTLGLGRLVELDGTNAVVHLQVGDVRAGQPAQHGRRSRNIGIGNHTVVQEKLLDTRLEDALCRLRVIHIRIGAQGIEIGHKLGLTGQLGHGIRQRSLIRENRNRSSVVARAILILQIELIGLDAAAHRPREGGIDIVLQQHLEIQRREDTIDVQLLDDAIGVGTTACQSSYGSQHTDEPFFEYRFHKNVFSKKSGLSVNIRSH